MNQKARSNMGQNMEGVIKIGRWPLDVATVIRRISDGTISFEGGSRNWNFCKMSRFIESIICGIPLGQVMLLSKPKELLVADGKERLQAIYDFTNNDFRIEGASIQPWLNGLFWKDMLRGSQRTIEYAYIECYVIQPETDHRLYDNIFRHINGE